MAGHFCFKYKHSQYSCFDAMLIYEEYVICVHLW